MIVEHNAIAVILVIATRRARPHRGKERIVSRRTGQRSARLVKYLDGRIDGLDVVIWPDIPVGVRRQTTAAAGRGSNTAKVLNWRGHGRGLRGLLDGQSRIRHSLILQLRMPRQAQFLVLRVRWNVGKVS